MVQLLDHGESQRSPLYIVGFLIIVCGLLLFGVLALGLSVESTYALSAESLLGIVVVVAMIGHAVLRILKRENRTIYFDLSYPPTLYGIFFVMYHLVPYLTAVTSGIIPVRHHLLIALLLCLAYVGWNIGIHLSRVRSRKTISTAFFKLSDAKALFVTCLFGILLVGLHWGMRIATGHFFVHGSGVETERTVEFSFFYIFAQSLQLPVLLVLGFLSHTSDQSMRRLARQVFYGYAAGLFLIIILSSQTRLAVTILLLFFMSLGLHERFRLRFIHGFLLVFIGIVSVITIQGLRLIGSDIAGSDNQLAYTFAHAMTVGVGDAANSSSEVSDYMHNRSTHGIEFLSELVDACENRSYLYGSGIIEASGIVIPRVLWPDKPLIQPYDSIIEEMLGIWDHDTAETPICEFYAEFGYLGVIAGHLLLGWFIGRLLYHLTIRPQVFLLLMFFFLWSNLSNLECEVAIESLISLRSMIAFYVVYRFVLLFVADTPVPPPSPVTTLPRIQPGGMVAHGTILRFSNRGKDGTHPIQ